MVEAKLKEIVAKHQEAAVQTGYKQIVTDENNEVTVTPADETQIKPKVKAKK
jgi:hypothetical protein